MKEIKMEYDLEPGFTIKLTVGQHGLPAGLDKILPDGLKEALTRDAETHVMIEIFWDGLLVSGGCVTGADAIRLSKVLERLEARRDVAKLTGGR